MFCHCREDEKKEEVEKEEVEEKMVVGGKIEGMGEDKNAKWMEGRRKEQTEGRKKLLKRRDGERKKGEKMKEEENKNKDDEYSNLKIKYPS